MTARALLATAAIAAGLLVACGDDEDEGRAPAATQRQAPAGTPLPSDYTPLKAGTTYTTRQFAPRVEITPSSGLEWTTETGDTPESFSVALVDPGGGIVQGILGVHRVTSVYDPRKGGVAPGDRVPFDGDFATWLAEHPHLRTSARREVTLAGLKGVQLDVITRSSPPRVPDDCGKVGDRCVPLFYDSLDAVLYAEGVKGRFIVLEVDGRQVVIEQFAEPARRFGAVLEALRPTVGSLRFAGR
jgi:hypothetical protein